MTISQKILYSLILLFIAALLLPSLRIFNIATTVLLCLYALTLTSWKKKIELIKARPYIWWMIAFVVMIFISLLVSDNRNSAFRYLDPRLPLLYFTISIGLLDLKKEFQNKVLLGIAIVITIFAIACFCFGIYKSVTLHDTAWLYNDAITVPVTGQQSIYISLLVNIAIYIFAYFLFYQPLYRKYRLLLILAIVLLFVISFLLASRNLMLVLYNFTIVFVLYYFIKRKKYLEGVTLIMGLLICIFLVFKFFPKTINRFKELVYTKFDYQSQGKESHYADTLTADQWNGANTRLALWQCGWELFKQSPWIGINIGDKKDKLMEIYRQKKFYFAFRTEKTLHNNYLDILMSMGIIGLGLFLVGWIILPLRMSLHHRDILSLSIIATFAFAMLTENYFDRSLGGMLFGFFIPFLLSDKKKEKQAH